MITQESQKYWTSYTHGCNEPTLVYLLSGINHRNGTANVRIIESGLLEVETNTVINGFNLIHGVLHFMTVDEYKEQRKYDRVIL
ncbi:hypothetical protein VP424E501_P0082 [Vibrio phage 424E50-1]|nr:hypothetical protein VP424E501_P0082 [Vibrio phage 424E50-1]